MAESKNKHRGDEGMKIKGARVCHTCGMPTDLGRHIPECGTCAHHRHIREHGRRTIRSHWGVHSGPVPNLDPPREKKV